MTARVDSTPPPTQLAQFMRVSVGVPFAFAMLESGRAGRRVRVHRAAVVLNTAAKHLRAWRQPPVRSSAGREVFHEYARDLERRVVMLELAASQGDDQGARDNLEEIRQTCNSCHHFFRPAAHLSPDVAFDPTLLPFGGDHL